MFLSPISIEAMQNQFIRLVDEASPQVLIPSRDEKAQLRDYEVVAGQFDV